MDPVMHKKYIHQSREVFSGSNVISRCVLDYHSTGNTERLIAHHLSNLALSTEHYIEGFKWRRGGLLDDVHMQL